MASTAPTDGELLSVDELFEVLGHRRRRRVLVHLASLDDRTSLDALVTRLAEEESVEPRSVRISLHHAHLPKLREAGLVDGPDESDAVAFSGQEDRRISALLEAAGEDPTDVA